MNKQLNQFRQEIDSIDSQLIDLLGRRFSVTRKVGKLKAEGQLPSVDLNREKQQMQRLARISKAKQVNPDLSQKILRNIIDEVVTEHQSLQQTKNITVNNNPTVGIIGLGDFGSFTATALAPHAKIRCFDAAPKKTAASQYRSSLKEVIQSQFVILAVPFSALKFTLLSIRPHLHSSTTLIDVCSVKVQSEKVITAVLPQHKNVVFTHPLFGPQSAAKQLAGHTIVFTNPNTAAAKSVMQFCRSTLGLNIIAMSATEHDKAMAEIHALTFFLARGLNKAGVTQGAFQTPSFQMLLDLVELDNAQSEELFRTVELANPYAANARKKLLTKLNKLHNELTNTK